MKSGGVQSLSKNPNFNVLKRHVYVSQSETRIVVPVYGVGDDLYLILSKTIPSPTSVKENIYK